MLEHPEPPHPGYATGALSTPLPLIILHSQTKKISVHSIIHVAAAPSSEEQQLGLDPSVAVEDDEEDEEEPLQQATAAEIV